MRLAFCFISNNDDSLRELIKYFHYEMNIPPYVIDSYSLNLLTNPPLQSDMYFNADWNIRWKVYISHPTIDMFSLRQDSFEMAGNAEIIFVGDDDMRINYESSQTINECCQYMLEHPDCGAIYLGGNFGGEGDHHGDEIYITNKGHLSTNRGILVRNRPNILDNRLHALGANFDFALGFSYLIQGYYIARRLHVPIDHLTNNIMRENHPNMFYDLTFLKSRGIMSKVNKLIGSWTDHSVWPEGIFAQYRQMAMVRGFTHKYDIDGNIFGR
jgi:hypothetical protein